MKFTLQEKYNNARLSGIQYVSVKKRDWKMWRGR